MQDFDSDELPIGESYEAAPGVVVARRCFMATSAALFAAVNLPGMAHARRVDPRTDSLSYDDFLKEVVPLAKKLVTDTSVTGQARYLHTIAAQAVRLGDLAAPELEPNGEGTSIGSHPGGDPFVVLHWRMEPGSLIGTHPHTYGNVVTLVLEGDVRIANYEVVGTRDYEAKGAFRVRRTVDQWLSPGHTNLVNLERNYMHGFRAGTKVARGLDITTRIREKRATPALELAAKPLEGDDSVWEARWRS